VFALRMVLFEVLQTARYLICSRLRVFSLRGKQS